MDIGQYTAFAVYSLKINASIIAQFGYLIYFYIFQNR